MTTIVTEAQLSDTDLIGFHEVLLISDPADEVGVLAFAWPQLAPLSSSLHPGTPVANQLKVLVDDPHNYETLARVTAIVISRRGQ